MGARYYLVALVAAVMVAAGVPAVPFAALAAGVVAVLCVEAQAAGAGDKVLEALRDLPLSLPSSDGWWPSGRHVRGGSFIPRLLRLSDGPYVLHLARQKKSCRQY